MRPKKLVARIDEQAVSIVVHLVAADHDGLNDVSGAQCIRGRREVVRRVPALYAEQQHALGRIELVRAGSRRRAAFKL